VPDGIFGNDSPFPRSIISHSANPPTGCLFAAITLALQGKDVAPDPSTFQVIQVFKFEQGVGITPVILSFLTWGCFTAHDTSTDVFDLRLLEPHPVGGFA
jgi:hypothetical protein